MTEPNATPRWLTLTKRAFTPIALAFLVAFAWQARAELGTLLQQASIWHLVAATATWAALHCLAPWLAVVAFAATTTPITWQQAFGTHVARLPARYVPGGVWHTVGRVMDYHALGIEAAALKRFVLLEHGLAAALTLGVGGAVVWWRHDDATLATLAGIGALGGFAGLVLLPRLVGGLALAAYARAALITALFWSGAALAFLLFFRAFPGATTAATIDIVGTYLFSWGVGFLAIFAPQGIGVFEAVASETLASPVGFMGLAALLAGFRVVVLVADVLTFALFRLAAR